MQVLVNDTPVTVPAQMHISGLIAQLELSDNGIAVAVNHEVINRQRWDDYPLQANDTITFFSVVAGG
ncbi:MAG: sulfur carrier protein ThiS [Alteromonadaceae bacterium]|nr:sulfur carrier protein ThiS [Alteromonadaceae bacterium]